jgi:hypothetical protein
VYKYSIYNLEAFIVANQTQFFQVELMTYRQTPGIGEGGGPRGSKMRDLAEAPGVHRNPFQTSRLSAQRVVSDRQIPVENNA